MLETGKAFLRTITLLMLTAMLVIPSYMYANGWSWLDVALSWTSASIFGIAAVGVTGDKRITTLVAINILVLLIFSASIGLGYK